MRGVLEFFREGGLGDPEVGGYLDVDTRLETHDVGATLGGAGGRPGVRQLVPNTEARYAELLGWALGFGALSLVTAGASGAVRRLPEGYQAWRSTDRSSRSDLSDLEKQR